MADGIFTFDLVDQAQASPADVRAKDDSDAEEVRVTCCCRNHARLHHRVDCAIVTCAQCVVCRCEGDVVVAGGVVVKIGQQGILADIGGSCVVCISIVTYGARGIV